MDENKFREDHASYVDQYREACRSYDGAVLTLAAAAFGLSVTIVDKVGHSWMIAMVAAWIFFALSIGGTVVSFFTSQLAGKHRIRELEQAPDQNKGNADKLARITDILNWTSLTTFLAGLVLFSFFVVMNFVSHREVVMSEKKDTGKIHESVNTKIVQEIDKRGFPTVGPAKPPPPPPPSSTDGESSQKKD